MKLLHTDIPDVFLVDLEVYRDKRGFFTETYHKERFAAVGIEVNFVQDNHSGSQKGILRGLHYQIQQPQGKLIRALRGEIFDVAVDLRQSSKTFGRWVGIHLTERDARQLWIPPGFAHGFYVLSDWAEVLYKVSDYYAPQWERTLLWNDSTIGIEWPLLNGQPPILSEKDANGLPLDRAELFD